jgi:hypothetical protein
MGGSAGAMGQRDMARARPADRFVAAGTAVLLALSLLAGCAGDTDYGARAFAVQHKNDWRSCEQLAGMHASYTKQIDDLKALMDKAARDPGGGFVNATAHGPTLASLQAERHLLHETIVEKNCSLPRTR